jgi:hypothetical protein
VSVRSVRLIVLLAVVAGLANPISALAQTPDAQTKHWGVGFSFTPQWKANEFFQELFITEGEPAVEGTEFSFGVVRGSRLGGDWGVSYVRKPIKDGHSMTFTDSGTEEGFSWTETRTTVFQKVYYEGFEVHMFVPVANIKDRVQIGFNVAGGIGFTKGDIREVYEYTSISTFPGFPPITQTDRYDETLPAEEVILKYLPFGKAEAQVSFIVAGGFKVKASFGLNIPSAFAFRIGAVYLIGAK